MRVLKMKPEVMNILVGNINRMKYIECITNSNEVISTSSQNSTAALCNVIVSERLRQDLR